MSTTTTFPNLVELQALPTPSCELAENPLWDYQRNQLYWVDIPSGRLFCWNLDKKVCETLYEDVPAAGVTLQSDGKLLLFRTKDAVVFCPETRELGASYEFPFEDGGRFNDVIADPMGRVYCGRLTKGDPKAGGLYRMNWNGSFDQLWLGTGCSNGMGFTKNLQHMYWTCSTTKTIFRFRYDPATAELTEREVFKKVEGEEAPDGLTVDYLDRVFSARWGGSSIVVYDKDGEELDRISIPVQNVTSMVAGGFNMNYLFVTTAGGKGDNGDDPAGKLYCGRLTTPGKPEYPSRIGLISEEEAENLYGRKAKRGKK